MGVRCSLRLGDWCDYPTKRTSGRWGQDSGAEPPVPQEVEEEAEGAVAAVAAAWRARDSTNRRHRQTSASTPAEHPPSRQSQQQRRFSPLDAAFGKAYAHSSILRFALAPTG